MHSHSLFLFKTTRPMLLSARPVRHPSGVCSTVRPTRRAVVAVRATDEQRSRRDLLLSASAAAATLTASTRFSPAQAAVEGEAAAPAAAAAAAPPSPPPPDPPITHTAFLDLAVAGRPAGRLLIDLYGATTPRTVSNFLALAGSPIEDVGRGSRLVGKYRGSIFHRLVATPRPFVLQGGDFERGNGTGGRSIYGGSFPDEAFIPHGPAGAVSMANRGPNTGGSQFFITLAPTPWLDGKHVVFGRLRPESAGVLASILDGAEVDFFSRPRIPIAIADCGLLVEGGGAAAEKEKKGAAAAGAGVGVGA